MKYAITVKPGASKDEIIETSPGNLTVRIHAKPHDGEANTALIGLLSKYFDVPKTSIAIVKGEKSRNKVIEF